MASLGTLLTFGNLPVGLHVFLGFIMTMGGYHAVEGLQDIAYGKDGDITTESVKLLKILMGEDAFVNERLIGE